MNYCSGVDDGFSDGILDNFEYPFIKNIRKIRELFEKDKIILCSGMSGAMENMAISTIDASAIRKLGSALIIIDDINILSEKLKKDFKFMCATTPNNKLTPIISYKKQKPKPCDDGHLWDTKIKRKL